MKSWRYQVKISWRMEPWWRQVYFKRIYGRQAPCWLTFLCQSTDICIYSYARYHLKRWWNVCVSKTTKDVIILLCPIVFYFKQVGWLYGRESWNFARDGTARVDVRVVGSWSPIFLPSATFCLIEGMSLLVLINAFSFRSIKGLDHLG